jgi:predicted amidohydrolase YtcJ
MIVLHPRIHTFTDQGTVSAMRVIGGRVVALGEEAEILASRDPGEPVYRPGAACILPGLIDTHAHLTSMGQRPGSLHVPDDTLPQSIAAAVRGNAAGLPAGSWVTGRAWNQSVWPEDVGIRRTAAGFPTHQLLTEACPQRPVMIQRADQHAVWLNRAAMEVTGLWRTQRPDPEGGTIDRDEEGYPSGVLIDAAIGIARRAMPPLTPAETRLVIRERAARFVRAGVTCVHCALIRPSELGEYREAVTGPERVGLRVRGMVYDEPARLIEWAQHNRPEVDPTGLYHLVTLKAFADGALGSKGAWFWEPYEGSEGCGKPVATPREVEALAAAAIQRGFQLATHAIGDRAVRETMDAYVRGGWTSELESTLRFRIEHVQHTRPEDLDRMADLRLSAAMQPIHCTRDMRFAQRLIGAGRAAHAYPWAGVLRRGIRLGFGSDYPIETMNPWVGLHAAVTRQDSDGSPECGWQPQHRLQMSDALDAYLREGARMVVPDDGVLGHLGSVADFIAVDTDPLTDTAETVAATNVFATVIAGSVVSGSLG